MQKNKAFTLIELLLVIAIIGILSSIVLVSISGAREKAQIARKIQQAGPFHRMLGVGLVGEWRFDGNYNDTSGNGNHLTTTIGVDLVDSFHSTLGQAARLHSNARVRGAVALNTPNSLRLGGGDVSIAAWIKINGNCIDQCHIFYFQATIGLDSRYSLRRQPNTNQIRMEVGSYESSLTEPLEEDVWYFVVGTYNHANRNLSIYIDAEKGIPDEDTTGLLWGSSTPLSYYWTGYRINATLDDVRVYREAFTEAQVRKMYAEEISRKGLVIESN